MIMPKSDFARRVLVRLGGFALGFALIAGLTVGVESTASATPTSPAAPETLSAPEALHAPEALSVVGSDFDPGNIISDAQFYQSGAMTEAEIQAFLDSKIGTCSNSNCLNVLYARTEARSNDRNICTGFTPDSDAIERASAIIYKVQQSCGISAKVILVTLQKEQSLVTSKGPTTGRLGAAMGWLCPDTAPCDEGVASFFRQVYGGTWQLKRYNTPDYWGTYHPGTYSILYNPNTSCGRRTVTIKNDATAALYNYTPYTPNAGALANLYGTADCGSYGNRNFWTYFNDWFGNPAFGDGVRYVTAKYTATGGEAGPLGAATSTGTCSSSVYSCYQNYQHGVIYWSSSLGAFAVTGSFGDYYLLRGGVLGPLGPPTSDYYTVTDPNGDGFTQGFANGMVYNGPPGRYAMIGASQAAYTAGGWLRGPLGWPTSDQACVTGGCSQTLERGAIYTSGAVVAAMDDTLNSAYRTAGGPTGAYGWPLSAVTTIESSNGNGRTVGLTGGMLYNSANGTVLLPTEHQRLYVASGWIRNSMGWPTAAVDCTLPGGGCRSTFQQGDIYVPKTGTGFAVSDPAIAAAYRTAGGPAGSLGWPSTAVTDINGSPNGNGRTEGFTKGMIYLYGATAVSISNPLQKAYVAAGWVRGSLGWPTAQPTCAPDGSCTMSFEHGSLYQPGAGGGFSITDGRIADAYVASGGATGPLGAPISLTTLIYTPSNGQGNAQGFKGGMIYASAQGTFTLTPAAQRGFIDAGWLRGPLGWPTADPVCDGAGCVLKFQGGTLYVPASGAAFSITNPELSTYYDTSGAYSGPLGFPVTATASIQTPSNGSGFAQGFSGGYIYTSSQGTFSVMGAMGPKFLAAGWLRGPLGWPIADGVCGGASCTQAFQQGSLTTP